MSTTKLPNHNIDTAERLERQAATATPVVRPDAPTDAPATVITSDSQPPRRTNTIIALAAAAVIAVVGVATLTQSGESDPQPEPVPPVDQSAVADWARSGGFIGSSPTGLAPIPIPMATVELPGGQIMTVGTPSINAVSVEAPSAGQLIQQSIDDAIAAQETATPDRPDSWFIERAVQAPSTNVVQSANVPSSANAAERWAQSTGPVASSNVPSSANAAERWAQSTGPVASSNVPRSAV